MSTVPVGMGPTGMAATATDSVTDCPATDGFTRLDSTTDAFAAFTVCDSALDVDVENDTSPANTAVIEREPTARPDVVTVATSDASNEAEPISTAPSKKSTFPV